MKKSWGIFTNKFKRTKMLPALVLAATVLVTGCGTPVPDEVTILLDGKEFREPAAQIHEGQLMVPASFIQQALGKRVEWEKETDQKGGKEKTKAVHYSGQVGVLMYHDIMEQPDRDDILSTQQFKQQMELLRKEGFVPISMEEYLDFIGKGKPVPDNAVLITFDDGYESFYKLAYPILKEYKYPAANFIIVSTIDKPAASGRPKLTWEQMREMTQHDVGFYNHTYDMHRYGDTDGKGRMKPVTTRQLYLQDKKRIETEEEYKQRVKDDLIRAEARLKEELGNTRSAVALPYGAYNDKLLAVLDSIGVEALFMVKEGRNGSGDRNGFRINGGRSDQSPEAVMAKLKGQDPTKRKMVTGEAAKLKIDGEAVQFSKMLTGVATGDVLVPLREICQKYEIKVDWNHKKKRAVMTTSQAADAGGKE